jgi:hypothetical protein
MKALLLGPTTDVTTIGADLAAAGYDVVRCSPATGPSFPCVGVRGTCPLDATIDVAVVVHDDPTRDLGPAEVGVVCALRDGVPLVLTGSGAPISFTGLVDAVAVGRADVVAACERAVAASLRRHAREIAATLDRAGDAVHATLDPDATDADAVRAHGHLRRTFPAARTIDVSRGDDEVPSEYYVG